VGLGCQPWGGPPPLRFGWNGEMGWEGGQHQHSSRGRTKSHPQKQNPQTSKRPAFRGWSGLVLVEFPPFTPVLFAAAPSRSRSPLETKGWGLSRVSATVPSHRDILARQSHARPAPAGIPLGRILDGYTRTRDPRFLSTVLIPFLLHRPDPVSSPPSRPCLPQLSRLQFPFYVSAQNWRCPAVPSFPALAPPRFGVRSISSAVPELRTETVRRSPPPVRDGVCTPARNSIPVPSPGFPVGARSTHPLLASVRTSRLT